MTIHVLREKGETNQAIAARLGITEGAVRYHLKRHAQQSCDGRSKLSLIEELQLVEVVEHWWNDQGESLPKDRPPNIHSLWTYLVDQYAYNGSYKSVRKFARERYTAPVKRPFRRIETPPAAQMQSDWLEKSIRLRDADGCVSLVKLCGFVMTLSHSRKTAVIWSLSMDQLAWHHAHNEALRRLGGIAAVNRIDNLKTGVSRGSGVWGTINASYSAYARTMGFHVDPHEARQPQQKGKVERRVGAFKCMDLSRVFESIADLQAYTDETLQRDSIVRKCPVTGQSVHATWLAEKELLRPLPTSMPMPFDLIKQTVVYKDCTVRFEGRTYSVPYRFVNQLVEVRGCSGLVQIVDPKTGEVLKEHARNTKELLLIDPACYEPDPNLRAEEAKVPRPLPLGRIGRCIGRCIEQIASQRVAVRSIDFYAAIATAKATSCADP